MRFVLVFVSALLAAAAACISFRTPAPSLADPPPLPTKVSLAHRRRRRITLHQLAIALTCASPRLHLPASPPRELGYIWDALVLGFEALVENRRGSGLQPPTQLVGTQFGGRVREVVPVRAKRC